MEALLWWDTDLNKSKLAGAVFGCVEDIEKEQKSIHEANERHAKLYAGYSPPGLGFNSPANRGDYNKHEVTKNVVRSVCDTATALIGKTRPKATFLTDGGDWDLQRKAKLLDQAMVGAFVKCDIWSKWQKAFRDATILGTSCLKLIPGKGFVGAERTLIDEIIVDEREYATRDGDPYNIYQVKTINKHALKKKFSSKEQLAIINSDKNKQDSKWCGYKSCPSDSIVVIEAWHRESGGGEGRHVITTRDGVLLNEKWKYDWFPFIFFHWSEPISGFYGQGLAELLCGRQKNINAIYRFIRRAQELILVPRVFVDAANSMMKFHLNNEIGAVIPTRGAKPPVFYTPQALTAEIYSWLDNLEKGGYDEAGVSMMSASNQLPSGLESAPAQREFSYKEGQRFAPVSQRYENAFIETARKMVQFYRDMPRDSTRITFSSNKWMRQIPWKEVDMENDQYEMRIEASSIDSLGPAARIQAAIELSQTGWIDKAEGRRLTGHPDLVRSDQLNNASIEYAEWIAMQLTNGVKAHEIAPDGVAEDVMENYKHVRASYLMGKTSKLPQDRLDEHLAYLKLAEEVLNTKPPIQQPPMGVMPGQTMDGMPTTTPASPMGPAMPQEANLLPPVM